MELGRGSLVGGNHGIHSHGHAAGLDGRHLLNLVAEPPGVGVEDFLTALVVSVDQSHVATSHLAGSLFREHAEIEGPTNGDATVDEFLDLGLEEVEFVFLGLDGFENIDIHPLPEALGDDLLPVEVDFEYFGTLFLGF